MKSNLSRTLYFDCNSGISGDMILGALIDLGADLKKIRAGVKSLGLSGFQIKSSPILRNGIHGCNIQVLVARPKTKSHSHRHHSDIIKMIQASDLPEAVQSNALNVFERIAVAEAEIHKIPKSKVHFHEVGAVDSIVDVVGSALAIHLLNIDRIYASPLNLGEGFVECDHGILPVPAPATLRILKDIPCYSSGVKKEMVTPTGAALIAHFSQGFQSMPMMNIIDAGYGAGDHIIPETPNMLRVVLGEMQGHKEKNDLMTVEANIDDMNPEFFETVMDNLFKAGAVDVYLTPILMKKNRPATKISALTDARQLNACINILLRETSTFGVRYYQAQRSILDRSIHPMISPIGKVRIKIGKIGNEIIRIVPEYEDCKSIAKKENRPVISVYEEILRMAQSLDWSKNL